MCCILFEVIFAHFITYFLERTMKKSFQATALWCMTNIKELTTVALMVLGGCIAVMVMAGSVITNADVVLVALVAFLGFLPVLIGGLYEFYLSPSNWFLRDGDDGKL